MEYTYWFYIRDTKNKTKTPHKCTRFQTIFLANGIGRIELLPIGLFIIFKSFTATMNKMIMISTVQCQSLKLEILNVIGPFGDILVKKDTFSKVKSETGLQLFKKKTTLNERVFKWSLKHRNYSFNMTKLLKMRKNIFFCKKMKKDTKFEYFKQN